MLGEKKNKYNIYLLNIAKMASSNGVILSKWQEKQTICHIKKCQYISNNGVKSP